MNYQEAEKIYWNEITGLGTRSGSSLVEREKELVFTGEEYDSKANRQYSARVHFDLENVIVAFSRLRAAGSAFIKGKEPDEDCVMSFALRADANIGVFVYARVGSIFRGFRAVVSGEVFNKPEPTASDMPL